MKANKIFIAFLMGAASLGMSAQDSYNRVSVGFAADFFNGKTASYWNVDTEDYDDPMTLPGVNVQYVHGFGIGQQPLFVEVGVKGALNFKSSSTEDVDVKLTKLSVSVPVNLAYRISCGNNISVQPYTGFNLKANVIGKIKADYDLLDDVDGSMFDKNDVGKDLVWKRFQMGWQLGCGMNFGRYYAGLEYGLDFMGLYKKTNTSHFDVNVGIYF